MKWPDILEKSKVVEVNERKQLHLKDFIDGTVKKGDILKYHYGSLKYTVETKFVCLRVYRDGKETNYMVETEDNLHFGGDCSIQPRWDGSWNTNYFLRDIKRKVPVTKEEIKEITV